MVGTPNVVEVPEIRARLVVKQDGRRTLKSRVYVCTGALGPDIDYSAHNSSVNNVSRGIAERVIGTLEGGQLRSPDQPTINVEHATSRFRRVLRSVLPNARRVGYDEFLSLVPPHKKATYAAAVQSLATAALTRRDAVLKTFVKFEKINFDAKGDPAPRIIAPRDPRYNVELGRFLKPLEHKLYHAVDQIWGGPTIMKCYNSVEVAAHMRAAWDEFNEPVAVGLDASRFDKHVSRQLLEVEHSVYLQCFKSRKARRILKKLLQMQLHNQGVSHCRDGKVEWERDGGRMSGDVNTALGNCLLMCMMVWEWCALRRVRARLVNNGDDCVVFCERADLDRITRGVVEYFRGFGFPLKVECVTTHFEEVEFCQSRPMHDGHRWIMSRNPTALAKDRVCLSAHNRQELASWFDAVGTGGTAAFGNIPLFGAAYRAYKKAGASLGHDGKRRHFDRDAVYGYGFFADVKGVKSTGDVTDDARVSFWKAWGMTPTQQRYMEEYYRTVSVGEILGSTAEVQMDRPRASDSHRAGYAPINLSA